MNGTADVNDFVNRAHKRTKTQKDHESMSTAPQFTMPSLNDACDLPGSFNWNNPEVEAPRDPFPPSTGLVTTQDSFSITQQQTAGDVYDESAYIFNTIDTSYQYVMPDTPLFAEDLLTTDIFAEGVLFEQPTMVDVDFPNGQQ